MVGSTTWNGRWANRDLESSNDEELAARVARRDCRALELLYDRYAPAAMGLASRILIDQSAAEDVVQESFWRAWKGAAGYRSDKGKFCTWLLSIVHHLAIDEVRRRRSRPVNATLEMDENEVAELPDAQIDVSAQVLARLTSEQVRRAVGELPEKQREIMELAYFHGLTHHEIATRLGQPLGTVHTRARQGLIRLREQLISAE